MGQAFFLRFSGVLGLLAVVLGAFGAHGLESRITEDAHGGRITVGSYECLRRCPAGPSVLVRELPECEGPVDPAPGLPEPDGGGHYHASPGRGLDRHVGGHSPGKPTGGRCQG